jgi:hypothetical protein
MPNFKWSICEPDNPEVIENGMISKDDILTTFENYPWQAQLEKGAILGDNAHYSPSLEFENLDSKQSVSISGIGVPDNYEFYLFYKRPKQVSSLFGLIKKQVDNYLSDITGQTLEDVKEFLIAFINADNDSLEKRMSK